LSLVDHLDNREFFLRLSDLAIGVVVYEPMGSGALSGRPIAEIREVWAEWSESPVFKRLLEGENGEKSAALAAALRPVAEHHQVSIPQLAIAWVLHQHGVTAALAGSRNPAHVRANAAAADLHLDESALAELEALIPLGPTIRGY
jgi:aryl-alcohol dehydrogenase-like predicted oxidoreductase